ncbi:LytR C-terminal domain-containing protein [Phytohabitans sp. ZYX-F-186]|uniref:LytR C-terminal domain-containing protein n=1 Tax=Phytohabitans maris TaxID=3071409 RepID=A0ABU0ZHH2_9ACTN|nr:LytR C-terminal domain-containing protein [Phytohabitans sp. ZYX-F-186]MDQ7906508.1 LytR C-terminal domain-containing protein [Phytohabitans sp. ZYX-F-186]
MRALVVVGVLVVFALVFVAVALVRDSQGGEVAAASCPEGWPQGDLVLREAKDIKINVYNATDTVGLAESVAEDFAGRGFQLKKKGNDPQPKGVDGVALLRYGPKGIGSSQVIQAFFLGKAATQYDPKRADDTVDVVLGDQFQQLATPTEVNQSLVDLGSPQLPPGTCAAKTDA